MEMRIIVQGKDDPPRASNLQEPVIMLTDNEVMTLCLIESGMHSGEPSVIIISSDERGSVLLQTSLDKFLAGASALAGAAESRFGWTQKEGHFTLMPPDKETRKALLEGIKKELEGYDVT